MSCGLGNDLTALPASVFAGLSNLQELRLAYNDLTSLPASVFSGLTNLRELGLSGNELTTLPASVFAGLSNLRKLWLYSNGLTSLPDGLFAGLSNLTFLFLEWWNTPRQGPQPFELSFQLKAMGNGQFQVTVPSGAPLAITVGIFVDSQTQARVSTTIPAGSTQSPTFAIPQLTGSRLTAKPTSSFDTKKFVGITPFAHSSPAAFGHLQLTRPISFADAQVQSSRYLQGRNIAALTLPEAVDGSGDIAYTLAGTTADGSLANSLPVGLTFDRATRRLTGVPTAIGIYRMTYQVTDALSSQSASLTFNIEVAAPGGICDRTAQVRTAIVNAVSGISDCALITDAHLEDVTALDLSEQGITGLGAGDFAGLTQLWELNLADNSLSSLPAAIFSGLTKLQRLDLTSNRLTSLPDSVFAGLANLYNLKLGLNRLANLPVAVFTGLTRLGYLTLEGNRLTNLPVAVFTGLTRLGYLALHGNRFTSLPDTVFAGLTRLNTLSLTRNKLTSLPDFSPLTQLRYLYTGLNQLTALPDSVFAGLTGLIYLDLTCQEKKLGLPCPNTSFELSFQLRAIGNDQFQVTVPAGAPFAITVGIFVDSQTQARVSTTIPAGSTQSPVFHHLATYRFSTDSQTDLYLQYQQIQRDYPVCAKLPCGFWPTPVDCTHQLC